MQSRYLDEFLKQHYGVNQFIEGYSLHRLMKNPSCFSASGRMCVGSMAHAILNESLDAINVVPTLSAHYSHQKSIIESLHQPLAHTQLSIQNRTASSPTNRIVPQHHKLITQNRTTAQTSKRHGHAITRITIS